MLKNIIGVKNTGCDYSHQVKEQNAICVFMFIIIVCLIWKVNNLTIDYRKTGGIETGIFGGKNGVPWGRPIVNAWKKSRGTAEFLSILAYMPEYWRMVRDCNSHSLCSRAPFTARTLCACSEPGNLRCSAQPDANHKLNKTRALPGFCLIGGWWGIRTPGWVAPSTVFKTAAFDRSANHPKLFSFPSVFQPTVLFADRAWRHCSPLVSTRPRFACLAYSYARPPHSTALPTILNFFSFPLIFQPTVLVNGAYCTLFFAYCKHKNRKARKKH